MEVLKGLSSVYHIPQWAGNDLLRARFDARQAAATGCSEMLEFCCALEVVQIEVLPELVDRVCDGAVAEVPHVADANDVGRDGIINR